MTTVALGEVVDFCSGGTPAKANAEFWNGAVPWFSAKDIKKPRLADSIDHITEAAFASTSLRKLPAGTVAIVVRGMILAHTVPIAILDVDSAINQDIKALLPRREIDPCYLAAVLRAQHNSILAQVSTAAHGTKKLESRVLENIRVPLPSIAEQRRVAAILDQAEAFRAKRRTVLAHLDMLEGAIFREMFGDPVRNSQKLRTCKLGKLGVLDRGVSKHRPRNDPELLGGAHPLIQTGDVANSGGYITKFTTTYSDLGLAQSRLWPAGTLCITIAANIAKTGVLTFDACFPDSVVGFTADPETTTFVRVWLSFLQGALESSAPQSAQKNINLAILRGLDVVAPDRSAIVEFADRAERVRAQVIKVQHAVIADDELVASLHARAFRCEL